MSDEEKESGVEIALILFEIARNRGNGTAERLRAIELLLEHFAVRVS